MAITFVDASGGNFTSAATITTSEPAGSADDDIFLLFLVTDSNHNSSGTPPTGWTKIVETDSGTDASMSSFWGRRSGSMSHTWTSIFDATESGRWVMLSYRGCFASGDPQDVTAVAGTDSGTSWDTAAIVPTTDNCMVVAAFGADPGSDPYTFAWDGGIDERIDSDTTPTGQNGTSSYLAVGDTIVTPAGSTTLGGDSSVTDTPAYVIIALKPAGGAPAYQPRHSATDLVVAVV